MRLNRLVGSFANIPHLKNAAIWSSQHVGRMIALRLNRKKRTKVLPNKHIFSGNLANRCPSGLCVRPTSVLTNDIQTHNSGDRASEQEKTETPRLQHDNLHCESKL